jgi:integrase-like protein
MASLPRVNRGAATRPQRPGYGVNAGAIAATETLERVASTGLRCLTKRNAAPASPGPIPSPPPRSSHKPSTTGSSPGHRSGPSTCLGQAHRRDVHFLNAEQVNALANSINDRYRAAIYLAAYGGLRAGELWALRIGRINLLAATVEIAESASEAGGWSIGPTKTGKRRTIAIPRFLAQMLGEHTGRYPSADGFIFTAAEGGPVLHHNFRRRHFTPAVENALLPEGLRPHDLRHTAAALLIAAGRHLEEVKNHLGHSSIRVTSDRYGHLFPEARAAVANALDATYLAAPAAPPRPQDAIALVANANQRPRKAADLRVRRERTTGLEPATPTLARLCSTN